MNSPAKDVADHLDDLDLGIVGSTIFVAEEPATPNNVITVYDTGGSGDVYQDIELFQPTIQVRVRNLSYPVGYSLIEDIRDSLVLPEAFEINSHHYIGAWLQGDIFSLGKDQNNRYIFTVNFRLERQPL